MPADRITMEMLMNKQKKVVLVIVLAAFHFGPVTAGETGCAERMNQLEQTLRQAGHMSEDEIQSQLEAMGKMCGDLEREFPNATSAGSTDSEPELPMASLNPAYLEGMWCGVTGGQERGPWVFAADGSYQIGIRSGSGFTLHKGGDSIAHFHARFDRLASRSDDEFIVYRHARESVFTRGECR